MTDRDVPIQPEPPEDSPEHNQWMLQARCRGFAPEEFFPSDGVGVEEARKICAECTVQVECLEYALEHRVNHGVWGGCSERERRRILKRRRAATRAEQAAGAPREPGG